MRTVLALLVIAACSKDGGGGAGSAAGSAPAPAGSAVAKKGGGFSASLSADLAKEDTGSAAPAAGSAVPLAVGSNAGSSMGSSAVAMAKPDTKAADTKAAPPDTKVADTKTAPPDTKAAPPADTKVAPPPATTAQKPGARTHVNPPADLAAIKMDLEPNWDRDMGEAGTISFVLNVPNSSDTRLFSFHYGYDPATAPADRDLYKKWLADQKILNVTLDRQRGAAWYLEGTDGNGAGAFRMRVVYGGKQLVCWGSLYKDAASNPLGDLRDKVVMAAKKICETMSL